MKEIQTVYGSLRVFYRDHIFLNMVQAIKELCVNKTENVTVGLTGGSTPKAFYEWVVGRKVFSKNLLNQIVWMASDERYVPLASEESNFGNADRLMLREIGVPEDRKYPWKVGLSVEEAVADYNRYFKGERCFDLCFLGMGDDCHIGSLFPGSSLIDGYLTEDFAAVEVPGKGLRLTVTPKGLERCGEIIVVVMGKGKSGALKRVFEGEYDPKKCPAQLSREWVKKVVWLVDEEAASELVLPDVEGAKFI